MSMQSYLIEIEFGTGVGVRHASVTVNADDYSKAYTMASAHVRSTHQARKVFGGHMVGRPIPTDAANPGIVASKTASVEG